MVQVYVIWIVSSVVVGLIVAGIAKVTNRKPLPWFFLGFALNVLALIVIALIGWKIDKPKNCDEQVTSHAKREADHEYAAGV